MISSALFKFSELNSKAMFWLSSLDSLWTEMMAEYLLDMAETADLLTAVLVTKRLNMVLYE